MSNHPIKALPIAIGMLLSCALAGAIASPSYAATPSLRLYATTPDTVAPGEQELRLIVNIQNVGDASTQGPILFSDTFSGPVSNPQTEPHGVSSGSYVPAGNTQCESSGVSVACTIPGPLTPGAQTFIEVKLAIDSGASGTIAGTASVSGGGTVGSVQEEQFATIGPAGPFAFTAASVQLLNLDGTPATQASADPADYTTTLQWRTHEAEVEKFAPEMGVVERVKNVIAHLPPGMIGDPSATPAICTSDQLAERQQPPNNTLPECPLDSQIGIARVTLEGRSEIAPLYNVVAPYGVATELGFELYDVVVLLDAYVRPIDHGVDVVSRNTSTSVPFTAAEITVWGDPASHLHDPYRDACLGSNGFYQGPNGLTCPTSASHEAFLRMPTSCSGQPLVFGAESNSYEKPETWAKTTFYGPTTIGCDRVPFTPEIKVYPTATVANSPTGVSVKLSVPQEVNDEGLAQADLKKAVVTLPEGMAINPSSADGLQACDDAHLHLDSNTPAECPDGSKIGTVLLHTPLIPNPIEGSVFLRPQNSSDPMSGEMFRMVIELRDDAHGLDFKIPGHVQANPVTGRLTTTFDDNPQFPFEDISLQFKSGARAPLVTPAQCQTQTTEALLYPYSRPTEPVSRSNSFALTSGPEGTPCMPTQGFAPGFNAGVSSVQAGGFTPFLTTFTRKDSDQGLKGVSVTLPLGLSGSLTGLPLCPEALAATGKCEAASEIGTVTAGAGAGPTPFYVTGGKAFMTGPYEGAPFGLSIVVPAKAGPFDLGNVNVRAKVEVDPHTAQLTVSSDAIPVIVSGVPVNVRLVNVTVNRPKFVFNPTDCNPLSVTGRMTGAQGGTATVTNHFQVTNCAALRFEPSFSVSTSAKASRTNGASLNVKLTYPANAFGKDTNIAKVKVALPKQLPSRLTTLQKACRDSVFESNPAACPPESRVGYTKAITPLVPVPLEGPAYFVSHGGAKFPDLVFVLQGYGVTVDLVGTTFIDEHTNVTSTTFKQVPDVPVGSFELHLPAGRFSALAAIGNLCDLSLKMPTAFVAQDGAEIHRATPIAVTGCSRTLRVLRHSVRGSTAGVTINTPLAGRLSASGNGIAGVHRRVSKPGQVSLSLALTAAERRFLAAHPGRRVRVRVRLVLAGAHGARLHGSLTLLLG